ncbi:MAG: molybdate ABC transporter permease subunit [Planctomycetota bacterium]|jgi:molybdate transport system permease protein|nr:molybdate ABC transporter permease subunit [Planctomycetota bacterium]
MSAVSLSILVGLLATLLALPPALFLGWVLERTRWPGRGVVYVLVLLPLVLPPVVTGYLLLEFFSPRGMLGRQLESIGLPVAFHLAGAVVAASVVGFPLLFMLVSYAYRSVDPALETVSRSLGRGGWETWWRVTLPLAWPGVAAGALLAFARALGEFGATIVLAGHVPGETGTIPLAVMALMDVPGAEQEVFALCGVSIFLGVLAVVGFRALDKRHRTRLELDR